MANYADLIPQLDAVWKATQVHRREANEHGCVHSNYAPAKARGYAQVRFKGKKYYVHIVAAMFRCKRAPRQGEEASHLCHDPQCVNPQHLFLEDGLVNKSRLCCKLFASKDGYRCPHEPVCFGCKPV